MFGSRSSQKCRGAPPDALVHARVHRGGSAGRGRKNTHARILQIEISGTTNARERVGFSASTPTLYDCDSAAGAVALVFFPRNLNRSQSGHVLSIGFPMFLQGRCLSLLTRTRVPCIEISRFYPGIYFRDGNYLDSVETCFDSCLR